MTSIRSYPRTGAAPHQWDGDRCALCAMHVDWPGARDVCAGVVTPAVQQSPRVGQCRRCRLPVPPSTRLCDLCIAEHPELAPEVNSDLRALVK